MSRKIHLVTRVGARTIVGALVLSILFGLLKFFGFLKWSWWIVSFPLWFLATFAFVIFALSLLGMVFISVLAWLFSK